MCVLTRNFIYLHQYQTLIRADRQRRARSCCHPAQHMHVAVGTVLLLISNCIIYCKSHITAVSIFWWITFNTKASCDLQTCYISISYSPKQFCVHYKHYQQSSKHVISNSYFWWIYILHTKKTTRLPVYHANTLPCAQTSREVLTAVCASNSDR